MNNLKTNGILVILLFAFACTTSKPDKAEEYNSEQEPESGYPFRRVSTHYPLQ